MVAVVGDGFGVGDDERGRSGTGGVVVSFATSKCGELHEDRRTDRTTDGMSWAAAGRSAAGRAVFFYVS